MAGAPFREQAMAHYKERAINIPLTAEQAKEHPLVYAGHDMGEVSYTYFMVVPIKEAPKHVGPREFVCPFERIVRWPKCYLREGDESTFGITQTLVDLLDKEQLITQMRVKKAIIESQLGPQNPKMYALSRETATTYIMRKKLLGGGYPEEIVSVGAQSKFSYFFLKCPSGSENYDNRKRLSVVILEYLFDQWYASGKLPREWHQFYQNKLLSGSDKKDDYSDSALMLIVFLLEELGIAPQWTALEGLYAFLLANPRYGPVSGCGITQKWPLAFTALGEDAFDVLERRSIRELDRARSKLEELIEDARERLRGEGSKQAMNIARLDKLNLARIELTRCTEQRQCALSLRCCRWMLGNREKNKGGPKRIDIASDVYVVGGKAKKRSTPKVDPAMEREYASISASDKKRRIAAPSFGGRSTAVDPNDFGVDLEPDVNDLDALMAAATS
jgi:hypothetical protein